MNSKHCGGFHSPVGEAILYVHIVLYVDFISKVQALIPLRWHLFRIAQKLRDIIARPGPTHFHARTNAEPQPGSSSKIELDDWKQEDLRGTLSIISTPAAIQTLKPLKGLNIGWLSFKILLILLPNSKTPVQTVWPLVT
jgi:hypothetical protein